MRYKNIAGMVTIYNPDVNVYENINTYSSYLDKVYIVINSEINNDIREKLNGIKNAEIIDCHINLGIAKAINVVLDKAKYRYDWLLTMDQDSSFIKKVEKYLAKTKKVDTITTYGITLEIGEKESAGIDDSLMLVDRCITSGMLLNVKLAIDSGGFDEKLFIDEVDFEFCYRCNLMGYKLYKYPVKIIDHHVGNYKKYKICGFRFTSDNEKYFRQYYIFRNSLYVMKRYRNMRIQYTFTLLKRLIKIILVEEDKKRKCIYIAKGIKDFVIDKMGAMIG